MADKARTVLSVCNNMGEVWLLTAEILDLIEVTHNFFRKLTTA